MKFKDCFDEPPSHSRVIILIQQGIIYKASFVGTRFNENNLVPSYLLKEIESECVCQEALRSRTYINIIKKNRAFWMEYKDFYSLLEELINRK